MHTRRVWGELWGLFLHHQWLEIDGDVTTERQHANIFVIVHLINSILFMEMVGKSSITKEFVSHTLPPCPKRFDWSPLFTSVI